MPKQNLPPGASNQAQSAKGTGKATADNVPTVKRTRILQGEVPALGLEQALRVPKAIFDQYAGREVTPLELAAGLDMTPTSGPFRTLTGAAVAYGLAEGAYNSAKIKPTPLASRVFRPLAEGQDIEAKRSALLTPRVVGEFLRQYDANALPRNDIALNVLESLGVPHDRLEGVLGLIVSGARACGLIRELKGKEYVELSGVAPLPGVAQRPASAEPDHESDEESNTPQNNPPDRSEPFVSQAENKRVFITHGKNKSLIEPIKKLVAFGELEAVVAVESTSVSKPVPDKVMADMRSCSGAIIHVDAERDLTDKDGHVVKVLNENVLIEIGAAMALYGRRFILLVREGVSLPSNLQGLFEVRYQADDLGASKTIELLDAISKLKKEPILKP
jgi:predicted nucleotide-binding protein